MLIVSGIIVVVTFLLLVTVIGANEKKLHICNQIVVLNPITVIPHF